MDNQHLLDFKANYKKMVSNEWEDNFLRWELFRFEYLGGDPNVCYNDTMLEVLQEVMSEKGLERITKEEMISEYYTRLKFYEYLVSTKQKGLEAYIYLLEEMKSYPNMPEDYITFINELIKKIVLVNEESERNIGEETENETPENKAEIEPEELDFTKFL
ncbi:hypothetical protein MTW76_00220 [Mammaliicoccus sciuri]|uniref:hypothetical protein n=1 Tax=Mammaliicoccus sciuri TaxID=1296 RepID=UPI001FB43167|nr:hypothetical protein [Mammaliicoccus sciuri]MCJ0933393.1 hypothetical protein [Mammaliicoccus sciuri]